MLSMTEILTGLNEHFVNLSDKDALFANDLMNSVKRRAGGPSEKQAYWLRTLHGRATGAAAAGRKRETVGDLAGVVALFAKARQHLKSPAIVLGFGDRELRLNVAGASARVPGSINVLDNGDRTWFGRILIDGAFEHSPRAAVPATLSAILAEFARDPAGVAARHGRLTGKCCFCNSALTDARSTAVGYGPICAKNYGLPWGAAAAASASADCDELEMQRLEAEGDRAETIRDERNKHAARAAMEAQLSLIAA